MPVPLPVKVKFVSAVKLLTASACSPLVFTLAWAAPFANITTVFAALSEKPVSLPNTKPVLFVPPLAPSSMASIAFEYTQFVATNPFPALPFTVVLGVPLLVCALLSAVTNRFAVSVCVSTYGLPTFISPGTSTLSEPVDVPAASSTVACPGVLTCKVVPFNESTS